MKKNILLLFAALATLAASAHDFEVNGIYYNITSSTTAEVTFKGDSYDSYYDEYSSSITIPATVTYNGAEYSVTSIEISAFQGCTSLTAITIPKSVTSIGGWAFNGCSSLTSINIPEGVTSIGDAAFYYCSSLTDITIPEGVTSIGGCAFQSCSSLTAITIPEGVTSIGDYAFWGCSSLTAIVVAKENKVYDSRNGCNAIIETNSNTLIQGCSATIIPEGVTSIRDQAFSHCSSPTAITIPEGVTSIGEWAFDGCSGLTAITLPESVTSIGSVAFRDCSSLATINIPENSQLTSIGEYAFYSCSSLTAITLPEGVTSIGMYTFYGCSSLTAITLPEGVTSIGMYTFYGCSSLTSITCNGLTPPTIGNSDTFANVDKSIPVYVPAGSVEAYHSAEYWNKFTNIKGVVASGTCGDNLTWKLTEGYELVIEGTGDMYDYEPYGSPWYEYSGSIQSISLSEGMTSIGDHAFSYCSSLTAITIPEGVTRIGEGAFRDCRSLTDSTIPEGVTSIGSYVFSGCSSLTAIIVEEGNEVYDSRNGCNAIIETNSNTLIQGCSTTIIPEGVTRIGDYAFSDRSSLTAITIPEGVTSIGEGAFMDCSSLTSITLPEGVTSIGSSAFQGCSSLTAITIPESVTSIGSFAFCECSSLTDITIPEGVTSIEDFAFHYCTSLTAITLPEGVTSIGDGAFQGCSSLTAITIPEGVTSIGYWAFFYCSSLTDVYCYAEKVPSTDSNAFNYSDIENATLHVPASALETYKTTAPWSSFGTIKTIENVTLEKCATPVISYVDGKVELTCKTEGAKVITTTTDCNANKFEEFKFDFIPTYTLTAYATKANYEDSDLATLTLCWIPCTEEHEENNGILTIPSKPVLISTQGGTITLSGLAAGTAVAAYSTAGTLLATATATDGTATLATSLEAGSIAIVKMGNYSIRIAIK